MKRKIVSEDKKERVVVRVCETCRHFYPEVSSDSVIRFCLLGGFWLDADDHINSFPDNDCADYIKEKKQP